MTQQPALDQTVDRSILIHATPDVVFRFFTDSSRWAGWWGAGSSIEPYAGGHLLIRYPDGTEATGNVVELVPPERIVFTYGYVKGTPVPPGASVVTIQLQPHPSGTRLLLSHAFSDSNVRDEHVQGWRYQLSLFANAVANEVHSAVDRVVDQWFAVWSEPDGGARNTGVRSIVSSDVAMRDQFSAVEGVEDLTAQVAAFHRFMPGFRIERDSDVRQCQGTALADWRVTTADGRERGRGTNVFVLDAQGRITSVTGFWRPAQTGTPATGQS